MAKSAQPEVAPSWLGAAAGHPGRLSSPASIQLASVRLWHGFMTARVMIGLVLLLLQVANYLLGQTRSGWLIILCCLYLAAALAVRLLSHPGARGDHFDQQWGVTIAVDVLAFSTLQFLQAGAINYTPLFALPVLLAAVLGSLLLALGTTALVTLLLLADAWWMSLNLPGEMTSRFMQAGLTGSGLFVIAFLTHQLALRLSREEEIAQRSQRAARVQALVNELIIENLTDGVMVIDLENEVRAANPSARQLVGYDGPERHRRFVLDSEVRWQPLARLAKETFDHGAQAEDVDLLPAGASRCCLQVRTQLATTMAEGAESLCVMFLKDRREMEARMRTEKLAAMGRMSAAVAHEIRNPLAAITQANALLDEELTDTRHKRLTLMVLQNAQRLARIVDEILDIARVEHMRSDPAASHVPLDMTVQTVCREWLAQGIGHVPLATELATEPNEARFMTDHLRRVLVNLLDNARRYSVHAAPIHVSTKIAATGQLVLRVWSSGPPLEQTVQRHLFEPFFSSESRSSGLGLYICRELCERHGAVVSHERASRETKDTVIEGNEFSVIFQVADARAGMNPGQPALAH